MRIADIAAFATHLRLARRCAAPVSYTLHINKVENHVRAKQSVVIQATFCHGATRPMTPCVQGHMVITSDNNMDSCKMKQ